jgi:hypothetical protein
MLSIHKISMQQQATLNFFDKKNDEVDLYIITKTRNLFPSFSLRRKQQKDLALMLLKLRSNGVHGAYFQSSNACGIEVWL